MHRSKKLASSPGIYRVVDPLMEEKRRKKESKVQMIL
jgi:hypothetical protein